MFQKIRKGQCDVDDPIWKRISAPAKDLVVSLRPVQDLHLRRFLALLGPSTVVCLQS